MQRPTLSILSALLLSLSFPPPAGAGSVSGRLLDGAGRPIAGAKVQWTAYRSEEETLVDQTTDADPAVFGETSTDAEGRFRVVLDKPGTAVALRVLPAGLPSARFSGPFDSSDDSPLFDIQVPAAEKLAGRVIDEEGKPVAGAKVTVIASESLFETEARFVSETRTQPDGSFSLPDAPGGLRVLTVRAPGFVPFNRTQLEPKSEEKVTLRRGGAIRGSVVDAGGKPAAGAVASIEELAVETDAGGNFRLSGVPAGTHALQAIWKEDFAAHKENVRVKKGEEIEVPLKLSRAAAISGMVIDEGTRKVIAGARVSASAAPAFPFAGGRGQRSARTDAQGRFRLRGLAPRPYVVEGSKEGYLSASIAGVTAGTAAPGTAHLALPRAASISGRVVDEKGQAVTGARVRITREMGMRGILRGSFNPASFFGGQGVLTGPDGSFRLRQLAAARNLALEAAKTGYATARKPGVWLKAGEAVRDVSLVLRKGLEARGRVVDSQGQPIAGAEIRVGQKEAGLGGGRVQMRLLGMDREKPDALTGADGSFDLKGLEEGEYTVAVSRDGFSRKTVPGLEVKATGENVWPPITLSPGLAITGFVRDSKGQPIPGAQIFAFSLGEGGRPQNSSSDAEGRFRLDGLAADRSIMLNVSAEGYAAQQKNVTPPGGELIIVLKSAGTLRGRVEDADTKRPVTDFTISRSAGRGGGFNFIVNLGGRGGDRSFQSEDGTFELTDVPAGKWTVKASATGYRSADISGIEVGEAETKDGILLSLKKGGVLAGRVLDPRKGTGVPNASVSWQASGGDGPGGMVVFARLTGGNTATTTDADGRFHFDGLPQGKVTVSASHADFLEASKEVDLDKEPSVDITLGTGGGISGTVVGKDGRTPVPGALVSLTEEGDSAFGGLGLGADSTRTDGAGNFLFEHLKPGRFKVSAQGNTGKSAAKEVVLAEGQRLDGVLIEMATGTLVRGSVSGLQAGKLGGVRVFASSKEYSDNAVTDDTGRFLLRDVPPGVLRLQATTSFLSGRTAAKTFEIPEGSPEFPAEIVFEGTSRISGRVTRGEKPLPGLFVNANADPPSAAAGRATAQTDEDGRYALEGLNDGKYQVFLSGQGVSYRKTLTVSGDTPGDIQLPAISVTGAVTDAGSGEPVEGVTVQGQIGRETAGFGMKQGVTDSVGHYFIDDVDPGSYQVTARKSGYQLKTQNLTVGSDSTELNFALQPGEGVTIRVIDGLTGLPLKGVLVTAFRADGTLALPASPVNLDSTGKGEISSLGPGRYSLYVFSDGYAQSVIPAVDVPAPMIPLRMTPGGRVDIRTDTPFTARIVDASGANYLMSPWRSDGRISLSPPLWSWDHFAPGQYRLIVTGSGGEKTYPFKVEEGRTTTVEVK